MDPSLAASNFDLAHSTLLVGRTSRSFANSNPVSIGQENNKTRQKENTLDRIKVKRRAELPLPARRRIGDK